jgi:class 3 adenylate cyclase/tetratricopeptide (TPR) repeat protein
MKCPKCQVEVADGAKFCSECGNKLGMSCPRCKNANPPGSKFCLECGHDLRKPMEAKRVDFERPNSYTPKYLADKILNTRSSIEGERKIVTIMFADVTGSTALFENLDPEAVHEVMDGCFHILMEEIHKYEGTINQFLGDGVMALFGAPISHEDHAQRACYAALAVQKALTAYGEKIKSKYGADFKMRIGLNSGAVVVGSIGDDLRMDYTAQGDTANLAARMQSNAPPGGVLASKNVYKLAKGFFEFEPVGEIEVKGKAEPVTAYLVMKPTGVETRIAASAAKGLTKFVGRSREVEVLREAFEKARSGDGQVVGIVGEAGVGKSRLLLEFRDGLARDEYTYFEGRCLHYGGSMAYLPILDVLRFFVGIKGGEQEQVIKGKLQEKVVGLDENLEHVIPSLQELLSLTVDDEEYVNLEPVQKKERTFESIRGLLVRSSRDRPLVLAVEDLHWIDKTTEEFLSYMIGWLPKTRILLLLLYRPEYTHQWGSKSYYSKIGAGQLSTSTSTELIGSILKEGEVASELRELILGRAAGNPLYLEELTHSLLENGSIQKSNDHFILVRDASSLEVPDTVQGIIAARMDRLEDSLKRIMQVAAVIGREFAFRVLEIITEMKEGIKSGLINLQGLEFIYEKSLYPELEYIFKHALTQEVAYNSLLLKRKQEIHERIGHAIEDLYPERLEEFYEILAYHYSKSNNRMKAYEYLKLSARKAHEREALWEAFRLYRDAADTLSQFPETLENKKELVQILLSMAAPMRMLGYPEDSMKYLQQCEKAAKGVNDKRTSINILGIMGVYHFFKGDPSVGSVCLENAFREANKLEDVDLIIPIGFDLMFPYFSRREMASLVDTADRVLPVIAKEHRERENFGRPTKLYPMIQGMKGYAMACLGDFSGAESSLGEALSLATGLNHIVTIAHVEFTFGCYYGLEGDGQACVDHHQQAVHLMEQIKSMLWLGQAYSGTGEGHYLLGRHEKAISYIEKGLGIQSKVGNLMWKARHYLHLGMIYFEMGDMAKASQNAEEALSLAQKRGEKDHEALSKIVLGRVTARKGKSHLGEAEQTVLDGIRILQDQRLKPDISIGYLHLGELYLDVGQTEKALQSLRQAETMFREMGMDYWQGRAQAVLGALQGNHG